MEKILLDTDIGTDIDDAVCLAYLLAHPDCELLGITTVTGEAEKRAMLASAVCRAAGKDIPIYPGCDEPILIPQKQKFSQQSAAMGNWSHQSSFPKGEAIEFLRRTIRAHPGEITLLTIAPLTNIGLLFSVDPEIPRLLKRLVMMCGRFTGRVKGNYGPVEWNAAGDPHATAIVYRSPIRLHRSVGLDVTSHVHMSAPEFRDTFKGIPSFGPILDFAEVWFEDWGGTTFHDPLAAATIFREDLCTYATGQVGVELERGDNLGKLAWEQKPGGPHQIAVEVQPQEFFRHYISVIKKNQA